MKNLLVLTIFFCSLSSLAFESLTNKNIEDAYYYGDILSYHTDLQLTVKCNLVSFDEVISVESMLYHQGSNGYVQLRNRPNTKLTINSNNELYLNEIFVGTVDGDDNGNALGCRHKSGIQKIRVSINDFNPDIKMLQFSLEYSKKCQKINSYGSFSGTKFLHLSNYLEHKGKVIDIHQISRTTVECQSHETIWHGIYTYPISILPKSGWSL
ncbi:MAG: hypothetical protein HON90_16995 [Halobacteriovoraceae bacterium]|jgi:hypothetical protein|nr:hypothetical protein [Halobacteriovoraceae bacterium]